MANYKPLFKVGYAGETTYDYKGIAYSVRHHAWDNGVWAQGYFQSGVLPTCGTI